jgi:hypothetical protein
MWTHAASPVLLAGLAATVAVLFGAVAAAAAGALVADAAGSGRRRGRTDPGPAARAPGPC